MDEHGSLSEVAKDQKGHILTRSNLAYGHYRREKKVRESEYEMSDLPSDAAMATQEATYETVFT